MSGRRRRCEPERKGVAIISFVAALLIIGTLVLWVFQLTASTSASTLGHFYSTGAFYSAESGMEMALREISCNVDFDGDASDSGVPFGTISDNGNEGDDPALLTGAFHVDRVGTAPVTYRATGRPVQIAAPWDVCRRVVEVEVQ